MISFGAKRKKRQNVRKIQHDDSDDQDHTANPVVIKSNLKPKKKQNRFQSFSSNNFDDNEKDSSEGEFDENKFQKFKASKAKKLRKQEKREKEREKLLNENACHQPKSATYSKEDLEKLRSETKFKSFSPKNDEQNDVMEVEEIVIPNESEIRRAKQKRRNVDSYISLTKSVGHTVDIEDLTQPDDEAMIIGDESGPPDPDIDNFQQKQQEYSQTKPEEVVLSDNSDTSDKIHNISSDDDIKEIKVEKNTLNPLKSPLEILDSILKSKLDTEERIDFCEKEIYRIKLLKDQTDPNNTSRENLDYNFTQNLLHFAEDLLDMLEVKQKQVTDLRQAYVKHLAKSGIKHKEIRRTEVLIESGVDIEPKIEDFVKIDDFGQKIDPKTSEPLENSKIIEIETKLIENKRSQEELKKKIRDIRTTKTFNRQLGKIKTPDGYSSTNSSDDEELLFDPVFDDVSDELNSVQSILTWFEKWKTKKPETYVQCYTADCIGKIMPVFIEYELLQGLYNPLKQDFYKKIIKSEWFVKILNWSKNGERISDKNVLNVTLLRAVIPFIKHFVEHVWDVTSISQTKILVSNILKFAFLPGFSGNQSKQVQELLKTLQTTIEEVIQKDGFIPPSPKNQNFHSRQCWRSVKIVESVLCFRGLLSDELIEQLIIQQVMLRSLRMGLKLTNKHETREKILQKLHKILGDNGDELGNDEMFHKYNTDWLAKPNVQKFFKNFV